MRQKSVILVWPSVMKILLTDEGSTGIAWGPSSNSSRCSLVFGSLQSRGYIKGTGHNWKWTIIKEGKGERPSSCEEPSWVRTFRKELQTMHHERIEIEKKTCCWLIFSKIYIYMCILPINDCYWYMCIYMLCG